MHDRGDYALLAVAVLCASASAPLIAATMAPGLAIAFWRTGAAAVVIAVDATLDARALGGDVLAMLGGMFGGPDRHADRHRPAPRALADEPGARSARRS